MKKVNQRTLSQKLEEMYNSAPQFSVSVADKTDLDVPDLLNDKEYETYEPLAQPTVNPTGMAVKEDDEAPILPPKGKRTFVLEPPDDEQEVLDVKIVKGPEVDPNKKNIFKFKSEQTQYDPVAMQPIGTSPSPTQPPKPKKKQPSEPGDDDYLDIDKETGTKPETDLEPVG